MGDKLKPCPFCGGEAELTQDSGFDYGSYIYWVECLDCRAQTFENASGIHAKSLPEASAIAHVKKAWNRRVGDE